MPPSPVPEQVSCATFTTAPEGSPCATFATAPEETVAKLCEAYRLEPYPSQHQMEKLARAVRAPSKHSVFNFFKSMQLKACELCGR